jgi:hypothetical protein
MFSEPIAVDIIAYNVLTAIAASHETGPISGNIAKNKP